MKAYIVLGWKCPIGFITFHNWVAKETKTVNEDIPNLGLFHSTKATVKSERCPIANGLVGVKEPTCSGNGTTLLPHHLHLP